MAFAPVTSSQATSSASWKQTVRQIITNTINSHFSSTLGTEKDIVNIVMAQCYKESTFRPDNPGPLLQITSVLGADYWNSSPVKSLLPTASPQQKANLNEGLTDGWGILQVGGWNIVRNASRAGTPLLQYYRPDLSGQLMVNAGESIRTLYNGQDNINTQILAGCVILEGKWKRVSGSGTSWSLGAGYFNSKIAAAVAGYNGAGPAARQYSDQVVYGSAYQAANGTASTAGYASTSNPTATQTTSGPQKTTASGNNQGPVGC